MSVASRLFRGILVAGAIMMVLPPSTQAQGNVCESQAKRRECSEQCCGRRSCSPSCEVDCVRACVDACKNPALFSAYNGRLRDLRIRCGDKSVR